MYKKMIFTLLTVSILTACKDDSPQSGIEESPQSVKDETLVPQDKCSEQGTYACKSGDTEPLYPFQWALNYKNSFFNAYKDIWKDSSDPEDYDLNVQKLHEQEIKGQGVNVVVLDDGLEINHEDLVANVDKSMAYNFLNNSNDPTPMDTPRNVDKAHGTNIAGIIAAVQNGKGIMGIAPRVNLGGAMLIGMPDEAYTATTFIEAYGGADFSKKADIFNASYGMNPLTPQAYDAGIGTEAQLRALVNLRAQKGAIYIKAVGNSFDSIPNIPAPVTCPDQFKGILSCDNTVNDTENLEPTVISVAALNTKGLKASYSTAGAVNWVTGLGGEMSTFGNYGESNKDEDGKLDLTSGPYIFSTDLQGCKRGFSRENLTFDDFKTKFALGSAVYQNTKINAQCNYGHLNGTSAAAPTVTGVTALILQANPNLTWRDVREIIRRSSRVIDQNYPQRTKANHLVDLTTGKLLSTVGTKAAIKDGATQVPLEFGWQTNSAGIRHSNWYGFGLIDADAAVKLAKSYTAGTLKSTLSIPKFTKAFEDIGTLSYQKVTKLGVVTLNKNELIDQFQLRISGPLCAGSVGFFVKSPSGVVSALSVPYNVFYRDGVDQAKDYGLGSYAFYGEKQSGQWEIYAVSGDKGTCNSEITTAKPLKVEYRVIAQVS